MQWKNVYVFISSTFNDMHAERDYLLKRCFPALRTWCAERKLKLIDIDLRWGISEEDASQNKRVLDICMQNVDKCRPFFLCFLGQRRGWVPQMEDINPETLQHFPELKQYIGRRSITELEIIHALMNPLHTSTVRSPRAFFYFRNPSYLMDISDKNVRALFSPVLLPDLQLNTFKNKIQKQHQVHPYDCRWDNELTSPELINCNGQDLSHGRLTDFSVAGQSLASFIIAQLKEAISAEFPEHQPMSEASSVLSRELDIQADYLFKTNELYLSRLEEEKMLLDYLSGNEQCPYLLKAPAGTGKTSLLSHLVHTLPQDNLCYRFIGISQISSDIESTLMLLFEEMYSRNLLTKEEYSKVAVNPLLQFSPALEYAAAKGNLTLVLDAIDQFSIAPDEPFWIPVRLPKGIKLILSFKDDAAEIGSYCKRAGYPIHTLSPMNDEAQKKMLVDHYLSQYLKAVDDKQLSKIIALPGSSNPLYLKIRLEELRLHGSFETLGDQISSQDGETPLDAFDTVLSRLEQDFDAESKRFQLQLVKYFAGTLAYSLEGLDLSDMANPPYESFGKMCHFSKEELADAYLLLARHLSPYLTITGSRINYLYDSFRQAARKRYASYEENFHIDLLAYYNDRLNPDPQKRFYADGQPSDLSNIAYHAVRTTKTLASAVFLSPHFVLRFLKEHGTLCLSDYFEQVAALMDAPDEWKELANALLRCETQIQLDAQQVFFVLKRLIPDSNSAFKKLYTKAVSTLRIPHLDWEDTPPLSTLLPRRSYQLQHPAFPRVEEYFCGDYLLQYCHTGLGDVETLQIFYLQQLYTGKIIKCYLPHKLITSLYLSGMYLHLLYEDDTIEVLQLPNFEVVSSCSLPPLQEGFYWNHHLIGLRNRVYIMAYNERESALVHLNHSDIISTPQVFCRESAPINNPEKRFNMDWWFKGKMLIQQDTASQELSIRNPILPQKTYWSAVLEDEFPVVVEGKQALCVISHSSEGRHCYRFRLKGRFVTSAELVCEKVLTECSGAIYYDMIDQYLLATDTREIYIYDENLNYIGQKKTDHLFFTGNNQEENIFHPYKGYQVHIDDGIISYYDTKDFFSDLSPQTEPLEGIRGCGTCLIRDNKLLSLCRFDSVTDLDSFENTTVPGTHVHYDSQNIYHCDGKEYLLGSFYDMHETVRIALRRLDNLEVVFDRWISCPSIFEYVSCYWNQPELGIVLKSKFSQQRDIQSALKGTVTEEIKPFYIIGKTSDGTTYDVLPEPLECGGSFCDAKPLHHNGKTYLLFNTLCTPDNRYDCCLLDLSSREMVFHYYHDADEHIYLTDVLHCNSHFLFTGSFGGTRILYDLDAETMKLHHLETDTSYLCGCFEDQVYLANNNGREITINIYSVTDHKITMSISDQLQNLNHSNMQIFRKGKLLLLFDLFGHVCCAFDADTGKVQFRQELPEGYPISDDPVPNRILMIDNQQKVSELKLKLE